MEQHFVFQPRTSSEHDSALREDHLLKSCSPALRREQGNCLRYLRALEVHKKKRPRGRLRSRPVGADRPVKLKI